MILDWIVAEFTNLPGINLEIVKPTNKKITMFNFYYSNVIIFKKRRLHYL